MLPSPPLDSQTCRGALMPFLLPILLVAILIRTQVPSCAADETAGPVMYYSQWGTPVCDDTATDKSQPIITVSGVVFADLNANAQLDGAERGLSGVCVSDGLQVVCTGPTGAYTLPAVQPGVTRTVFVTVPTGYRIGGRFYRLIPEKCERMVADFGLIADPQSSSRNHAFIHVTDCHLTRKGMTCFAEMKALPVSFIVATGDLSNNRELEAFQDAAAVAPVPVLALPGNHDVLVNGSGALAPALTTGASYEAVLGPTYYAFDYGGRHYVLLDSVENMPRQMAWLKNDLTQQPANTELLIFQHFPPTNDQMAFYQQYHTRAVFCGHTHANRVFKVGNILYVTTPPLLSSGLDLSPRTYRTVTFTDRQITLGNYATGFGNQTAIPALAPATAPPPAVRLHADWPMFKGDPARTGVARDAVKPPFTAAWTQSLGGTIHIASPVVGNGLVYIGVGDDTRAQRSGVYALDALTGKVRWHYPTAAKVAHSVSLADGVVLATSNDGIVHAIDAKSGAKRWIYSLGSPMDCWLYTSPVVCGTQVVCGTGQHFTALDLATGKPTWRMPSASAGHWPTYSSPASRNGNIVGTFPGTGVFLCDALTGTRRWQVGASIPISSTSAATAAISEHTVYVRTNAALFALDAATGEEHWRYANKGGAPSPVATETAVVLGMGNGTIVKLDAATGKELWTYTGGGILRKNGKPKWYFEPLLISTPIISGDIVYACTTDGQLVALNEATGTELAVQDVGMPITSSPAISGNTLFLASYTGTVVALVSTAP